MFSKKIWRKKRHLNLRMNPRVSCDCDFFRVGGGGILKLEEEKNVYTCTVCRCPLRVSTLAVFFLHFCSGPASILTEKHAGVISWRKVEGATETWTWKTNHLQPVWDAEKLCIEVINGKLFSACAFTTKRLHHEIFKNIDIYFLTGEVAIREKGRKRKCLSFWEIFAFLSRFTWEDSFNYRRLITSSQQTLCKKSLLLKGQFTAN